MPSVKAVPTLRSSGAGHRPTATSTASSSAQCASEWSFRSGTVQSIRRGCRSLPSPARCWSCSRANRSPASGTARWTTSSPAVRAPGRWSSNRTCSTAPRRCCARWQQASASLPASWSSSSTWGSTGSRPGASTPPCASNWSPSGGRPPGSPSAGSSTSCCDPHGNPVPPSRQSNAPLAAPGRRSGREDHLLATLLLVLEDVVPVRRLGQRQPVGDHPGGVDLAALDALEQRAHVPLDVALPGLQGQGAVHPRAGGELVDEPAVHADDRDDASTAARGDRLAESVRPVGLGPDGLLGPVVELHVGGAVGGLHAHGVDALVRAAAPGQ